ncbi:LPXTG cell wall anchor domain-containing protein [Micromonospora sp. CA-263727]|uniref:LPXTG cell wall anchor domain-containing protein n=1 Tax=Micromonospora sp. CA-263727 TaxID=3239967 RepID=UPI003D90A6B3
MTFRTRRAASLATAALLASGVFTGLSAPAHAAGTETDLAITAAGTRLTSGVEGKVAWAKIANQGEGTPGKVFLKVDISKVDDSKLVLEPYQEGGCPATADAKPKLHVCELDADEIPGPGETIEVPILLLNQAKGLTEPYSAPVTISVESPDDTDDSNNSVDINVELTPESGVDLGVYVPDVKTRVDFETGDEGPLRPGDTSVVVGLVFNQGDLAVKGVKWTYRLPEGVTFTFDDEVCTYSADRRTAVCEDKALVIETGDVLLHGLPVAVDDGVEAPVTLKEGWLEAEAFGSLPAGARVSQQATRPLSDRAEVRAVEDTEYADIDPSDNKDDFAVIVAADAGGGGGGGGGLPVTGVQAGLIGAIGAGVLLAGVAMFLVARRRRVVVVAPGDEKPDA